MITRHQFNRLADFSNINFSYLCWASISINGGQGAFLYTAKKRREFWSINVGGLCLHNMGVIILSYHPDVGRLWHTVSCHYNFITSSRGG